MDFLSTGESNNTAARKTPEPKKQRSLLRRLSSNLSLLSFRSDDDDASLVDEAQVRSGEDRFPPHILTTVIEEMPAGQGSTRLALIFSGRHYFLRSN